MKGPGIMILAGEASGDMHGAGLVSAMQELKPGLEFCGMGGEKMRRAGVDTQVDAREMSIVGLVEIFSQLPTIYKARHLLLNSLQQRPPDLLILIDFPDFNLMIAGKAKKLGVPVLYYIPPQVWAWRSGRAKKIARLVDEIAVILPFEEEFYKSYGIPAHFVGHPLMETVRTSLSPREFRQEHDIPDENLLIGILPGSRRKEIAAMLPLFLESGERLSSKYDRVSFVLPRASTVTAACLEEAGLASTSLDVKVIEEDHYTMMAACDLALAASGTVTLELAILGVPMVVAYRLSPLTHFIGKKMATVTFASLVNLVADREVVPEYLQEEAVPDNLAGALDKLRPGEPARKKMTADLEGVRNKLGGPGASCKAARLALELLKKRG
ncbi:MAG: lipid-A-disaccharide synthase [Desulfurivibrionaceae bacterium]